MLYREAIRLTSPRQRMGLYTNLGALLMGSGQIDDCLKALKQAIELALEYKQTDSYLVCLFFLCSSVSNCTQMCSTPNSNAHCIYVARHICDPGALSFAEPFESVCQEPCQIAFNTSNTFLLHPGYTAARKKCRQHVGYNLCMSLQVCRNENRFCSSYKSHCLAWCIYACRQHTIANCAQHLVHSNRCSKCINEL